MVGRQDCWGGKKKIIIFFNYTWSTWILTTHSAGVQALDQKIHQCGKNIAAELGRDILNSWRIVSVEPITIIQSRHHEGRGRSHFGGFTCETGEFVNMFHFSRRCVCSLPLSSPEVSLQTWSGTAMNMPPTGGAKMTHIGGLRPRLNKPGWATIYRGIWCFMHRRLVPQQLCRECCLYVEGSVDIRPSDRQDYLIIVYISGC